MRSEGDHTSWGASYNRQLKDILGLNGSPVAVAYSDRPTGNSDGGHYRVCGAVPSARDSAVISHDRRNYSCGRAPGHLVLGPPATGLVELLHCGSLTHGERLWQSPGDVRRVPRHMSQRAPSPRGFGNYLVLSPLERTEPEPNLLLFLCNPKQPCRLTALARYLQGVLPPNKTEELALLECNRLSIRHRQRQHYAWGLVGTPDRVLGSMGVDCQRAHREAARHRSKASTDRLANSARPVWRLKEPPARAKARREE